METKKTRKRRKPWVVLAVYEHFGVFNLDTPWKNITFLSETAAIEATASDPDFCRENTVVTLTVSPRIIVKPIKPRKPVMQFDTKPFIDSGGAE